MTNAKKSIKQKLHPFWMQLLLFKGGQTATARVL